MVTWRSPLSPIFGRNMPCLPFTVPVRKPFGILKPFVLRWHYYHNKYTVSRCVCAKPRETVRTHRITHARLSIDADVSINADVSTCIKAMSASMPMSVSALMSVSAPMSVSTPMSVSMPMSVSTPLSASTLQYQRQCQ